jgi:hypothetical protein
VYTPCSPDRSNDGTRQYSYGRVQHGLDSRPSHDDRHQRHCPNDICCTRRTAKEQNMGMHDHFGDSVIYTMGSDILQAVGIRDEATHTNIEGLLRYIEDNALE